MIHLGFCGFVMMAVGVMPLSVRAQTVSLTTNYPAPFGVYDRLRLVPQSALPDLDCTEDTEGTLYTDDSDNFLRVCSDSAWGWELLGGLWTQEGDNFFPAPTESNPNLSIGIGTTEPFSLLTIDEGAIAPDWTSFTWGPATGKVSVMADNPTLSLIGEVDSTFSGQFKMINVHPVTGNLKDMWILWREVHNPGDGKEGRFYISYVDNDSGPADKHFWDRGDYPPALTLTRDKLVGIANVSPQAKLDVAGDARISGHMALGSVAAVGDVRRVFKITEMRNPVGSNQHGVLSYVNNDIPLVAVGRLFGGKFVSADLSPAGVTDEFFGFYGGSFNVDSGSIGESIGLFGGVNKESGGSIEHAQGMKLDIKNQQAGGGINNVYGLFILNYQNFGTIANTYGIYIDDLNLGARTNQPYALYVEDPNTRSFFGGNVGIGTPDPAVKLDVEGPLMLNPMALPACNNTLQGTIAYDSTTHTFMGCAGDPAGWVALH